MGSENDGGRYSLAELFVLKFVLADVVIIAALLFAGPLYALAFVALLVLSVPLLWYLSRWLESSDVDGATADSGDREPDPVTALQARYAAGDLSEDEFEARLEALIEANERAERAGLETEELSLERAE